MTSRAIDFLIIGGGLAAATAAETLRDEGASGSILILAAEDFPPYHRPPLSKEYLGRTQEETQLLVHPPEFYSAQNIELQLGTRAVAVEPERHCVRTAAGEEITYSRLLIATGMEAKRLAVPGADLAGVHYLRSKADSEAIRLAASEAKSVVVAGASFLGMEVALTLARQGRDVTVIEQDGAILRWLGAPEISEYFRQYADARGVAILLYDTIAALGGQEKLATVETSSGRTLPCDLLVACIGVAPATGFLADSGIALDGGLIVVDDLLRTNVADVFAAGDVTSFYDPVFFRRRHIEHWDNAQKQGRIAARNMLDRHWRYDEVSYFYCDFGELSFDVLGATDMADERIHRGSLDARSFALFYLANNIPRALLSMGRPADETRVVETLIRSRVNLTDVRDKLQDPDFALDEAAQQTVLVLQGGGALGAFECGVVKALEEEQIFPDIVAGVSIGALNGAIIAGNPRHATQALEAFWADLTVKTPPLATPDARRATAMANILTFGLPKFFTPRWLAAPYDGVQLPMHWTSFYEVGPMRKLIAQYVDFSSLKTSPVRLLVGAVEVTTGELQIFDSYVNDLTPDHILASGSLPPGFPWTIIDGKAYWDGGIVSNSPLQFVVERCGSDNKRVFIVDLFAGQKPLPTNMIEVGARYEEIIYAERIRNDLRHRETVTAYRALVEDIQNALDPSALTRIRQHPRYIQLMGKSAPMNISRFVRVDSTTEPSWGDGDFSDIAVDINQKEGYALVKKTLGKA